MDQFLSGLNSLLAIKPKQGFVLLLGGSAIVGLYALEVWPFANIAEAWIILAAVVALAGLVVLAVALGASVVDSIRASAAQAAKQQERRDAGRRLDEHAAANLGILTDNEMGDLLWVLRSGNQRFQGDIYLGSLHSLTSKHIVGQPMLNDRSVFLVRDSIWEQREAIIEQHPRVRIPGRSPFQR